MSQHSNPMVPALKEPTFIKSYPVVHKANPKKLEALFAVYAVYQKEYKRFAIQNWAHFMGNRWGQTASHHAEVLKIISNTAEMISYRQGLCDWDDFKFTHLGSTKHIATTLNASWLQNCLQQVAATLNGHLSAIENRFNKILNRSSIKNPDLLHQLRSMNKKRVWLQHECYYHPRVKTLMMDDYGNGFWVSAKQMRPVSVEAKRLARRIFQSITRSHISFPHLDKPKMVLDTRTCEIQVNEAKKKQANKKKGLAAQQKQASKRFDYWLNISTLVERERVLIPIICPSHFKTAPGKLGRTVELNFTTHPYPVIQHKHDSLPLKSSFKKDLTALNASGAKGTKGAGVKGKTAATSKPLEKKLQAEKRQHAAQRKTVKVTRTLTITLNKKPTLTELRQQMQAKNTQAVQVAHVAPAGCNNGHANPILQPALATPPRTHHVGFDLGLSTLIATSDGELYGQHWLKRLTQYDKKIVNLSSQRQKLKLRVRSKRYDELVKQVRGFIRSEINRILNRYFQKHQHVQAIVIENLRFDNPDLSRRLNRIIKNFGQKAFKDKLKSLGTLYGVTIEEVEAAYSSQECSACGYVDAKNRTQQKHFKCKACGTSKHADYNASRVILGRSQDGSMLKCSWLPTATGTSGRKTHVLEALKQRFLNQANSFSLQRHIARRDLDLVLSENEYFTKPKPKLVMTCGGPGVAPAVAFVKQSQVPSTKSKVSGLGLMKAGSLF